MSKMGDSILIDILSGLAGILLGIALAAVTIAVMNR